MPFSEKTAANFQHRMDAQNCTFVFIHSSKRKENFPTKTARLKFKGPVPHATTPLDETCNVEVPVDRLLKFGDISLQKSTVAEVPVQLAILLDEFINKVDSSYRLSVLRNATRKPSKMIPKIKFKLTNNN